MDNDSKYDIFRHPFRINWEKLEEFMDHNELKFEQAIKFMFEHVRFAVDSGIFILVYE